MIIAYLALGSNLGERQHNLAAALKRIARIPETRILALSSFHETQPMDAPPLSGQFLNAAVAVETALPPGELMHALLAIEKNLGRDRSATAVKNAPRPIDLDLLSHGLSILHLPGLILPHPRMHQRRFVLEPLAEIAPNFLHPVLNLTIPQMLAALKDSA